MSASTVLLALVACQGRPTEGGPRTDPYNPPSSTQVEAGPLGQDVSTCPIPADPSSPRPVTEVVAVIHGTRDWPGITGEVRFDGGGNVVVVRSQVTGLPPGAHAHHVHTWGDCGNPGPALDFERLAGAYTSGIGGRALEPNDWVTGEAGIGTVERDPNGPPQIAGDLGDLKNGVAERAIEAPPLASTDSLVGRSVVVHLGPDDIHRAPDGGAGEAIACGVIGISGR